MTQATLPTPAVVTTRFDETTADTNWHDVTSAVISSANITAGNRYIVFASGRYRYGGSGTAGLRLVHGSTAFPGATQQEQNTVATTNHPYIGAWVWTAIASEDVKFQVRKASSTSGTSYADELEIIMIDVTATGLVEDTDFGFTDITASDALDVSMDWTHTNDASETFTASAGDYFVLTCAQIQNVSVTVRALSRLTRSGEASSNTNWIRMEGDDNTNEIYRQVVGTVYTLGAASNTFTQESAADASTSGITREYSSVFWMRLGVFEYSVSDVTPGSQALDATAWNTTIGSITFNPTTTPTAALFFKLTHVDTDKSTATGYSRLTGGGVQWPSTDTLNQHRTRDIVDIFQHGQIHYESAISASTTVASQAYVGDASGSPEALETTILGISLELAGAPPAGNTFEPWMGRRPVRVITNR